MSDELTMKSDVVYNLVLMHWLATGKGLAKRGKCIYHTMVCDEEFLLQPIADDILIRTWDNAEWKVPTLELMNITVSRT